MKTEPTLNQFDTWLIADTLQENLLKDNPTRDDLEIWRQWATEIALWCEQEAAQYISEAAITEEGSQA